MLASVLALASTRLKVEEDPRITSIEQILPRVNCGACGFLSCHDFAVHLARGEAPVNGCRAGGEEVEKRLSDFLGVEAEEAIKKIAVIHCSADDSLRKKKAEYSGIKTCAAKNITKGGEVLCDYGCLGMGDCMKACPFGAIEMRNALPYVNPGKCVACGKCISACPRNIISFEECFNGNVVYVGCSSKDKGSATRKICPVGCIACGICQKLSNNAFVVENNLSKVDYEKLSRLDVWAQGGIPPEAGKSVGNIDEVVLKCPTKVIHRIKVA